MGSGKGRDLDILAAESLEPEIGPVCGAISS